MDSPGEVCQWHVREPGLTRIGANGSRIRWVPLGPTVPAAACGVPATVDTDPGDPVQRSR